MLSETEDSVHTADADTSGEEYLTASGKAAKTKRQLSVIELMRRGETRKGKRSAPGECFNSPPEDTPGAKRRSVRPQSTGPVDLNPECMKMIENLMESATAKVILAFNEKFEGLQKRIEIVEAENFTKGQEISKLKNALDSKERKIDELQSQLESIDANRRLSCLILSCKDFERREEVENWEVRAAEALNKRVPDLQLEPTELSVAHRLAKDDKVIIKFVRRCVRNRVFECRFALANAAKSGANRATGGDPSSSQLSPLYISECLTPGNRALYDELLRARRQENGSLVTSVFSRNGVVICKKEAKGQNIRVYCEEDLHRILNGKRFPQPSTWGSGHRKRQPAGWSKTAENRTAQTPSAQQSRPSGTASPVAEGPNASAAASSDSLLRGRRDVSTPTLLAEWPPSL